MVCNGGKNMKENTGEKKLLGRYDILAMSIGFVIGAGIVTFVGTGLGITGKSVWLAYLVAIILGFILNIPYLLLAKTARLSGGPYNLISSLSNTQLGGIYVTAYITELMSVSLYAVSFAMYVKSLWPSSNRLVVSIAFLAVLYVINLLGITAMARVQKLMTVTLLVALLVYIVFGIRYVDPSIFIPKDPEFMTAGVNGFITCVFLLLFTTTAYNLAINFGNQAENAKRDIPWAMLMNVPLIFVVYVGVAIVTAGVLPLSQSVNQPLTLTAQTILPPTVFVLFMVGGPLMAISTSLNSCYGGFSSPFIQAAKDGWFPEVVAKRNRFGAPYVILTAIFLLGLIPVLLNFSISTITNNIILIKYTLALLSYYSIWQLPKKFPEQWKASEWYVTNGVFHFLMTLTLIVELLLIYYALKGLTITIIVVSLGAMIICAVYAIWRYKSGKVHVKPGIWFD